LEGRLQSAGVRAIVTSRAKTVGRLESKVRDRDKKKTYTKVEAIYTDIVDLAGARVALYFPAQREQVKVLINELFVLMYTKEFPDGSEPKHARKRFSGYCATHYRVRLRESILVDAQKRYAEALVEIQVASVLMHAWVEVEHDLVYKPFQGALSEDEYAILDELNGTAIAGEIALERLQRAGDVRVAASGRIFGNHYELAAHLLSVLREFADSDAFKAGLGRIDLLYELLAKLGLATPEGVTPYLAALHSEFERRPIADQIVDQVLSEDAKRYRLYEEIRAARPLCDVGPDVAEPVEPDVHEAIGQFLQAWIYFERRVRDVAAPERGRLSPISRLFSSIGGHDQETRMELEQLRRIRNNLVHGIESSDSRYLREAARQLKAISFRLFGPAPPEMAPGDELQ
jgi:ppGpp synthetase/RelA/SpoT-type nucleotidyltranferase